MKRSNSKLDKTLQATYMLFKFEMIYVHIWLNYWSFRRIAREEREFVRHGVWRAVTPSADWNCNSTSWTYASVHTYTKKALVYKLLCIILYYDIVESVGDADIGVYKNLRTCNRYKRVLLFLYSGNVIYFDKYVSVVLRVHNYTY